MIILLTRITSAAAASVALCHVGTNRVGHNSSYHQTDKPQGLRRFEHQKSLVWALPHADVTQ